MKLTQYTDLGLRLMMYLALRPSEPVTIQEVSERLAISKNHLVKISHQLTKSGLIASTRGRNGGIRLASAAEDITIEQVIKVTEESFGLVECFNDGQNRCTLVGACKLADVLDAALDAFFDVLRKTTLAELVENGAALEKMLLPVCGVNRVGSVAG